MNFQTTGDEEIFSVFDEALPVIHATLVSFYRFMEEEAEAFDVDGERQFANTCLRPTVGAHREVDRVGVERKGIARW